MTRKRTEANDRLRELSAKHGIRFTTLRSRRDRGDTGSHLTRPLTRNGRRVVWCGKSLKEWYEWTRNQGRFLSYISVSRTRLRLLDRGMTEREALCCYLASHNLLETYMKEMDKEEQFVTLFP